MTTKLPVPYVPPAADPLALAIDLLKVAQVSTDNRRPILTRAVRELLADDDQAPPAPAKAKPARAPKAHSEKTEPATPTPAKIELASEPLAPSGKLLPGLSVDLRPEREIVSFKGKTTEVTARMAQLAQLLGRGNGNPIDRTFLGNKMFPTQSAASQATSLVPLVSMLKDALAEIGLEVITVRGVGVGLRPVA